MIFLQVLKGHSIRNIAERFQHSYSTISIAVHQVSSSILKNEGILFHKHKESSVVHDRILKDPKYYPYIDNCDRALDGTHIPAILREEDQSVFRNRKKFVSQNVLGVTNFDAIFIYALAGLQNQLEFLVLITSTFSPSKSSHVVELKLSSFSVDIPMP